MSTKLVPFLFESASLRVVVVDGQPLFSARDIALTFGYTNPAKAYQDHCKLLKKLSYNELIGLEWENPNPQGEYVMPESDVYRMITHSQMPEAKKFADWVFEEVLPSIRQTGNYSMPQAKSVPVADVVLLKNRQAKSTLNLYLSAAKLLGTDVPMARAIAVDVVKKQHGVDFQPLLAGNVIEEKPITPTELGKLRGWTARGTNIQLALAGFQMHNEDGEWLPTEKGKPYSTCNPYKAPHSQHTGYRVLWYRNILDVLPEKILEGLPVSHHEEAA
jgi:prophage antirepressor-like protein